MRLARIRKPLDLRRARRLLLAAVAAAVALAGTIPAPAVAAQDGNWWRSTWRMEEVSTLADGAGVTVAVIDSGVDGSISELAGAVQPGLDLTEQGGDGLIDHSPNSHGTAMSSLIAGRAGNTGVLGVAPATTILPIAIAIGQGGAEEHYTEGIRFAADHSADVINMSIGAPGPFRTHCPDRVAAAVRYAVSQDVVVVAASGNDGAGADNYPGSCPGVLTVGAADEDLRPWGDSHQSLYVDLAAPGVRISSVGTGGEAGIGSGTSNSTALVSGVVALIRSRYPDETASQVVNRLVTTAQDIGETRENTATGHGLVRPYEALTTDPIPPDAPNPVYDGLDLTDTADPGPGPPDYTPPPAPEAAQPPTLAGDGSGTSPLILLPVAAVVLAGALTATILILVRARRRHRP